MAARFQQSLQGAQRGLTRVKIEIRQQEDVRTRLQDWRQIHLALVQITQQEPRPLAAEIAVPGGHPQRLGPGRGGHQNVAGKKDQASCNSACA